MKTLVVVILTVLLSTSCRTGHRGAATIVQPGAPGQAARSITADAARTMPTGQPTAADISFMQRMIGHHAQALEMTALLSSRTSRPDMRLLAHRIELSQADEITWMERWLEVHGQRAPDSHVHHASDGGLMPGMLTAEELGRLAATSGSDFDRLFLEFMIKHHEGALVMVNDLFMAEGAAQDTEVFAFASDVDADQRIEIDRMGALLQEAMK